MKKPVNLLFFLWFIVSLACSLPLNRDEPANTIIEQSTLIIEPTFEQVIINPSPTYYSPPTARPTTDATNTPQPTQEEQKPTESPTQTVAKCSPYGLSEFEGPEECWPDSIEEIFSPASISDLKKVSVQIIDGYLEFKSQLTEDIFLYSFYQDNKYDEVIIRAAVSKIEPSANQNGFTLACHVNQDSWYEVRISSSGIFEVYQYDQFKKQSGVNPYINLANGGVANFKTSSGIENIIEWQCGNDYLRFIVNQKQIWEKTNISSLQSGGTIGIGLASYSGVSPRHIGFEWVEIIKP